MASIMKISGIPLSAYSGKVDPSDATALTEEIFAGKTAYIASGKTTGTFTLETEIAEQHSLLQQIVKALENKASPSLNTGDATVVPEALLAGYTAYGANGKIEGTFTLENEISEQEEIIANLQEQLADIEE